MIDRIMWSSDKDRWSWPTNPLDRFNVKWDTPPDPQTLTKVVRGIGELAKTALRVEVPFSVVAPPAGQIWTQSSARGVEIPLGRAGARQLQSLKLGEGTSQHVLLAGRTGSGKSTLLHAIVTNAALRYSPDELELYLVDFKKGVEFKNYATRELPHAKVVAVESEREFGLSVLERLDRELTDRGERFRRAGVQDVAGFRVARPAEPLPRILLVVDEFQELFNEDDRLSTDAASLLDRLVRQGRAFGVHAILGSQSMAGAYAIARSTMGQMGVRIALQCNENDSRLILSEDNPAARMLSRPGEAIYNDANGLVEGNHLFQAVWMRSMRKP
jgi:DNA segregation ATPase FtsK/SpoIIIE-like protein